MAMIEKRIGKGLSKNHKCPRCPMAYHKERDLKLHLKHWHGVT